jgi:hypothetical protein
VGGVDWICLVQDGYIWRALVNGFHKMLGNYQMAVQLLASQVVLSSTEIVKWR